MRNSGAEGPGKAGKASRYRRISRCSRLFTNTVRPTPPFAIAGFMWIRSVTLPSVSRTSAKIKPAISPTRRPACHWCCGAHDPEIAIGCCVAWNEPEVGFPQVAQVVRDQRILVLLLRYALFFRRRFVDLATGHALALLSRADGPNTLRGGHCR